MSVHSEHGTAGEPGTFAGVSGCWRVDGVKGERSPLSCLGVTSVSKHEGRALSGLHLHSSIEYVQVYKDLSKLQGNIQAVLIFATGLKITEGATQSEQRCRAG